MIQHLDKQGTVYVERAYILRTERAESMHIKGRHEGGIRRNTRRRFMYVECMYIYIEVWDITERDYTQDKGEVPTDKRSTEWDILGDGTTPPTSRYIPFPFVCLFKTYPTHVRFRVYPPCDPFLCVISSRYPTSRVYSHSGCIPILHSTHRRGDRPRLCI